LETRAIVKLGLENIKNPGIKALAKVRNKNPQEMNSSDVSFLIAPMLNSTARLDKIELCLDLLLEDSIEKCVEIAKQMDEMRREKQEREMALFETYKAKVNPNDRIIIVTDPQASKNFNGLIAQQLARVFRRPAIVLREHNGRLDGSYRSFGDFNMKSYLSKFKILNYVGGHEKAGGIGLRADKLETLRRIINQDLANVTFSEGVEFDLVLSPEEITIDLIQQVQKFDYITGQGFERAKFLIRGISIDDIQYLGGGSTCKITSGNLELLKFKIDENWGSDLISFMFGDNVVIDALGSLNLNIWGRKKTMQVFLDEYRQMAG
ncbi:MAG TPA: DHHA1 domain-containing protein, partial [Pseudothermotoga sp.]